MRIAEGQEQGPGDRRPPVPVAPKRLVERRLHGDSVVDPYAWMSDHDDPELRAYLGAERAYHDRCGARLNAETEILTAEAAARTPLQPEYSVPRVQAGGTYRTRTPVDGEGSELLHAHGTEPERVILDVAALSAETGFAHLGTSEPSPDGRWLAWSLDTTGAEIYALRIRDLTSGEDLPERIPRTSGAADTVEGHCPAVAWSRGCQHLFYLVPDELGRAHQVRRHRVGEPAAADALVLEEPDQRFELTLRTSGSGELIIITAASRDTTEVWTIAADDPLSAARLIEPRRRGIEYRVEQGGDGTLYVVTDQDAPEFTLMRTGSESPGRATWTPVGCAAVAPLRPATRLVRCDAIGDHLVLTLRRDGLPLLAITDRDGLVQHEVRSLHPVGAVRIEHAEEDGTAVIVADESLLEPTAWYRLDLHSGERELLTRAVVRGHDSSRYRIERRSAPAPDGIAIPVTLVRHAATPLDGSAPCLLYGYGAYESSVDPEFLTSVDPEFHRTLPSLLDRGVVFAVAHVRGGGECGRTWWQQGRLRQKPTTFSDHIAVADWLAGVTGEPLVDGTRIASRGLSAGGLLQGAVYSQRPDRWCAVLAEVPFVDCVNSMLDASIPLTVNEWDEWGDPRDPDDYACIRSYSPYENPPSGGRPPLLVTGALHDPRVGVHEPAKWVAKLRDTDTEGSVVLFRADLGAAGHTGPSGRSARHRYEAEVQAFLLDAFGASGRASS